MGQLLPRLQRPRWLLRVMAAVVVVLVVLVVAMAALALAGGTAADVEFVLLEGVFLMFFGAVLGDAYLATRSTELRVRLGPEGVEASAGEDSLAIPWGQVERLWVVRARSRCPIVCVVAGESADFSPKGVGWRIKAYANRRVFGTPLAAPLAATGLSEAGVLDAVRSYVTDPDGKGVGRSVLADGPEGQFVAGSRRFRRRLAGVLAAAVASLAALAWLVAVAIARVNLAVHDPEDPMPTVVIASEGRRLAAVAVAVAVTLAVVQLAIRVSHAIVPLGDVAGQLRGPLLRVGPGGIEHLLHGKAARLAWTTVERVYLTDDRPGERFVCVTTSDPHALIPRVRNWRAIARRNERRHGVPVAAPLAGSGLTADDLVAAVRHYAGDQVTVALPGPLRD